MNEQIIRIDCIALTEEFPFMEDQCNVLADTLKDSGAAVDADGSMMVVAGLTYDDVLSVLEDEFDINILNIPEGIITEDYVENEDPYMNEAWDAYDDSYDDLEDEYAWNAEDEENMRIINSGRRPKETEMANMFDDYDEMTEDDEFDDDDMLNDDDMFCENDLDDMTFEDEEMMDECGSGDMFEDDDCIDCNEDEDFLECLEESYNKRKNTCCPPKKAKLVNLSESLKARKATAKPKRKESFMINESIFTKAVKKLHESKKTAFHKSIKQQLGEAKYNDVMKALKEGKNSLYTKKRINGKNIQEYTSKQLHKLLKEVSEQIKTLNKKSKSINESKVLSSVYEDLEMKKRLFSILDEELTYRLVYNKRTAVNEDEAAKSEETDNTEETKTDDTAAAEETDNTEEETTAENPEKDEEVELARVIITVANQEAADTLKSELVDAGIPEDVIEFETDTDEDAEESTEDDNAEGEDANAEESTEETTEDGTNESFHVNTFKRLLEDEETDAPADDAELTDDTTSEEGAEGESEEATDDTPVKVILTDTDHINTLAQVLNDVYGIEQEEFEEMIGGSIVNDEESADDAEGDNEEEKSEESTEDDATSKGDDAIDNMSDEDLAQLFGESVNK